VWAIHTELEDFSRVLNYIKNKIAKIDENEEKKSILWNLTMRVPLLCSN
jgi:hypothetical protein